MINDEIKIAATKILITDKKLSTSHYEKKKNWL